MSREPAQRLFDKLERIVAPEHLAADEERRSAEYAAAHRLIRIPPERVLDVLTLDCGQNVRRRHTRLIEYARERRVVAQIHRLGPDRAINRLLIGVEDTQLLRGDRAPHQ